MTDTNKNTFSVEQKEDIKAAVYATEDANRAGQKSLLNALTIVIPTYNELENLPKMLEALFGLGLDELQVLIVDDNSPDGTGQLAERLGREKYNGRVHVMHRAGKLGLGTAYIQGFQFALEEGSAYVVHMDADFSHDPAVIKRFLELIDQADVAIGSRYTKGGSVDKEWSLFRKFLSRGASVYTRLILGLKVNDTTAGFKMFKAEALKRLPFEELNCNGYCFHIAVAYLTQKHGLKTVETPIYFRDRTLGKSKMSVQIMIEAAWRVWEIKFKRD
jgi:dolichol-phosphate mannosyltransferase